MDPEVYMLNKAFFDKPFILTDEELKHPTKVLFYFLELFQLSEVRSQIALLKHFVIKAKQESFMSDKGRADIDFFIDQVEQLAEAVYQLQKNQEIRKNRSKK